MKSVECSRHDITPKAFYKYCVEAATKKGIDLESWTTFENWADEEQNMPRFSDKHEDWGVPKMECGHWLPLDTQLFLQDSYNFIMEFTFDDKNRGYGYCYIWEVE